MVSVVSDPAAEISADVAPGACCRSRGSRRRSRPRVVRWSMGRGWPSARYMMFSDAMMSSPSLGSFSTRESYLPADRASSPSHSDKSLFTAAGRDAERQAGQPGDLTSRQGTVGQRPVLTRTVRCKSPLDLRHCTTNITTDTITVERKKCIVRRSGHAQRDKLQQSPGAS